MMIHLKNKSLFLCSVATLCLLSACGGDARSERGFEVADAGLSAQERAVDPATAPVPEDALDPVQAHINARKRVNTSPTAPTAGYHVSPDDPAGARDPANFRVLKLDPQMPQKNDRPSYIPPRVADNSETASQGTLYIAPHPKPAVPIADVMPALETSAPETPAPAAQMATNVLGVRTGNYPNKARIVFDVSAATVFKARIEEAGRSLVIDMPEAGWTAAPAQDLGNPLARSYRTEAGLDGTGTRVTVDLGKSSRLVSSMALTPNETYGHRLVFDIAAQ
jgi:hypothetical protein